MNSSSHSTATISGRKWCSYPFRLILLPSMISRNHRHPHGCNRRGPLLASFQDERYVPSFPEEPLIQDQPGPARYRDMGT